MKNLYKKIDNLFFINNDDEKISGWLAMKTGKLINGDNREFCKIATPEDIKQVLNQEIERIVKGMAGDGRSSKTSGTDDWDIVSGWNDHRQQALDWAKKEGLIK